MIMKYLHEKMSQVVSDRKKISVENQTKVVEMAGVSLACGPECYLVFGLILLTIGFNSGIF